LLTRSSNRRYGNSTPSFAKKFGRKYIRLILFGSRARGDHQPDSDADIAVVLRGAMDNRWKLKQQMIENTYPILLDTGLCIQPWPIAECELEDPETSPNPGLAKNIFGDGVSRCEHGRVPEEGGECTGVGEARF
jgi:uncharacterized protein